MMKKAQKLGQALMQAVAVMPIAAILMGIGYWIDPNGWGADNPIAAVLLAAGGAILDNLGVIFAIAVAYGLAKEKNGAAALAGWVGFEVVKQVLAVGRITVYMGLKGDAAKAVVDNAKKLGWAAIDNKNVFIGIVIGIIAAMIYDRFHKTQLPTALAFFSGRRLVPILTSFAAIVLAGVLFFVWPLVYQALTGFGQAIEKLGPVGAGIYGFFNRLLIPTGLHHALNNVFWFSTFGINDIGLFLGGAKTIEAMGTGVIGTIGRYQAGFFPIMMFGLPGAALAMYMTAKPSKKKAVASLMIGAALASFFTGVTEPLEFSFMFVAPLLYVVHALLTGISVAIAAAMHWMAGFGFSAGLVDMVLSARNPLAHMWYMLLVQGVVFFVIYFFVFRTLILALNLKTPGREDDDVDDSEKDLKLSNSNYAEVAKNILAAVGGKANVVSVDNCVTRLRLEVKDTTLVNDKACKAAGAAGVIKPSKTTAQVIIGPQVEFVADEFKKLV